ncbi:lipase family protein [Photorhabdus namnaonensis]|uniref:Lipase (Class 3) n=1 Tax=Photorhabdus namnaonensis TaxID=1851568 RepID=A0A1B8YH22_9GAMM|nr:lipase family protein [Photorhabdus namnaonensis]OCA54443.1 Lipase (class 3) [Photorhabdus namnaonensis]
MTISLEDQKINLALGLIINSGSIVTYQPEPVIVSENIQKALASSKATANRFSIVWGPAVFRVGSVDVNNKRSVADKKDDHVLFIVKDLNNPNDYRIVIRGSWSAVNWFDENFNVGTTENWSIWDSKAPKEAKISKGTHIALDYIVNQIKSNNSAGYGKSLVEAIDKIALEEGVHNITLTGHSLGGVIASTLGVYLKRRYIDKGNNNIRIHVSSFAAPTAGNDVFAAYSESVFNGALVSSYESDFLRVHNRKDIVTLAWSVKGLEEIKVLYPISTLIVNGFISVVKDKNYTQLTPDLPFTAPDLKPSQGLIEKLVSQHIDAYAKEYGMSFTVVNDRSNPPTNYDIVVINDGQARNIKNFLSSIIQDENEIY